MIPDGHICHNICYLWWFCLQSGPAVYRSRSVFEDATPEVVRDFFWDDEFRPKWDTMFAYVKILEECPHTGTMIVHWIRKVDEMNGSYNFVCWCYGLISFKAHFVFKTMYGLKYLDLFHLFAVPLFLPWSRVHNWSKNMGSWEELLLCDKGAGYNVLLFSLIL